jgi:hypothetical protein
MFGLRDVLAVESGMAGMTWVFRWKAILQASRVRSSSWHAHGMFLSHAPNTDEIGRAQTNWVFLPKAIRAISPPHFSPSVIVSDRKGSTRETARERACDEDEETVRDKLRVIAQQ